MLIVKLVVCFMCKNFSEFYFSLIEKWIIVKLKSLIVCLKEIWK